MSEPTVVSLITEVLREHRPTGNWRSSLGHECLCRHWEKGDITDAEPLIRHTSEQLASRLNLHEEQWSVMNGDGRVDECADCSAEQILQRRTALIYAANRKGAHVVHRWVTPWTTEEQQ